MFTYSELQYTTSFFFIKKSDQTSLVRSARTTKLYGDKSCGLMKPKYNCFSIKTIVTFGGGKKPIVSLVSEVWGW